ncbi:hypothetical protein [uncultured Clostridium sp.]|uniref:hypothetical protein n=1 Tax=uncultured Clostridium sp. TaxID=59620 RepID=UPI0032173639
MKTLKKKYVKFEGEKEVIKLVELNNKDRIDNNVNCNYAITFGEYNDIDMEAETLAEAEEQYKYWGID